MPEWLINLIVGMGGGTAVLIGALTIFKGLAVKCFETVMESSFEKSFEKFKHKLDKSMRAYEILLNREMRFYEKLEAIVAELVPLEHDLLYYLEYDENVDHTKQCEMFREHFKRYAELTLTLKNENLIHHMYIPEEMFDAFTSVVAQMQDDMPLWADAGKLLFQSEYSKIDYKGREETVDLFLMKLACGENEVRKRLVQLSGEN